MKYLVLAALTAATLTAQQEFTTLCHVTPGNQVTIRTANPSSHVDPLTGRGAEGHEDDYLGPCVDPPEPPVDPPVDPPNDPPGPPEPPGPPAPPEPPGERPQPQRNPRLQSAPAGLIACVVFGGLQLNPILRASYVNSGAHSKKEGRILTRRYDHEGFILDDTEKVLPLYTHAWQQLPDFGAAIVKIYGADVRVVVEHDVPGKGLTREHGQPCWEGSDVPVYTTDGRLLARQDFWP